MKKLYLLSLLAAASFGSLYAAKVSVKLNSISRTMTLTEKATGATIEIGEASSYTYQFDAEPGLYVITGYAADSTTVNGTIELTITNDSIQSYTIQTVTAYATNKDAEGNVWKVGQDYTVEATLSSREGEPRIFTQGHGTGNNANYQTFLIFNGDSYIVNLIPSEARSAEGYLSFTKSGTVTNNANANGAIPMGAEFRVSVPLDAEFSLGSKTSHFVDFQIIEPTSIDTVESSRNFHYFIATGSQFNYRTWRSGGLTNAGVFTLPIVETDRPVLSFTDADYSAKDPKFIDRDITANNKYNIADIFVNINERGHLKLNQGETYNAMAVRNWQIIDGTTSNYFIEPDYHYTILNLEGQVDNSVITIEQGQPGSAWATMKAIGNGSAIVLVTYDALAAHTYSKAERKDFVGGAYWSAIWPENTAAYVVTVGQGETGIVSNMTVNEGKNPTSLKLAGDHVDAECDVFYYLKGEAGFVYTFKPEGVAKVEIAYPTIGAQMATYSGFGTEGVTANEDGSYTILLKQGRQIVRMSNTSGAAEYQVLTAKEVDYTLSNLTDPEKETFEAGDQVAVLFDHLYHPANKMSGIHNFNATIQYDVIPDGVKVAKGTANQYQFAATEKAQTYTFTLPEDWDGTALTFSQGTIKLGGWGDPIGNYRATSRTNGRNANFTAVQNTSLLCVLPDITIEGETASVELTVADFEDNDEISIDAATGIFAPEEDEFNYWNSGSYTFATYCDDWGVKYFYDIVVTNSTSSVYEDLSDQYNSAAGSAKSGKNYAVWYNNFHGNEKVYFSQATQPTGFYVTNTAWVVSAIINGDKMSVEADGSIGKPFADGDKLTLSITGYDENDESVGTIVYTLAEAIDTVLYYVKDWRWVDLSSLPESTISVGFTLSSTKVSSYGMTTPSYFCLDDFGGVAPEADAEMETLILQTENPSGIESLHPENASPILRSMDLYGRRIQQQRGISIIRQDNGQARKVCH